MSTIDTLIDELVCYRETLGGDCAVALALDCEGNVVMRYDDSLAAWIQPVRMHPSDPDRTNTGDAQLYRVLGDDGADELGAERALVLWSADGCGGVTP